MEWLTTLYPMLHGADAEFVAAHRVEPFNRELFHAGKYGGDLWWIQQESTFWRRELWDRAGGHFDESLSLAIDAELWARFFERSELYAVATPLAGFRKRPDSKTGGNIEGYRSEFTRVLLDAGRRTARTAGTRSRPDSLLGRIQGRIRRRHPTGRIVQYSHNLRRFVARTVRIRLP
jgi:hypothetical protein